MDYSQTMMSPNYQKSTHSTSGSEWKGETSMPKLFYQNKLSYLMIKQFVKGFDVKS